MIETPASPHKEQNEIRAAYHRSTYEQDRERPMQWWWAGLPDGGKAGNVVKMPQRGCMSPHTSTRHKGREAFFMGAAWWF